LFGAINESNFDYNILRMFKGWLAIMHGLLNIFLMGNTYYREKYVDKNIKSFLQSEKYI